MLVALVQGVIGAFHEDFAPLNDDRSGKAGQGTKDNLLEKRGLHPFLDSNDSATSPKTPLFCAHDPEPQEEIGDGVSQNTRGETLRSIGHSIIKNASNQRCNPIRPGMGEPKRERNHRERQPGESSQRYALKIFPDHEAKQKSAPKNLFYEWDDNREPQKPEHHGCPVSRGLSGKNVGIKTDRSRGKSEKLLWRNPKKENQNAYQDGEGETSQLPELIFRPKPDNESATYHRLCRIDPVLRRAEQKMGAGFL